MKLALGWLRKRGLDGAGSWEGETRVTDQPSQLPTAPIGVRTTGGLHEITPIVCEDDPVRDLGLVHRREGRAVRRTVRRWETPAADCREHHREVGEHDHLEERNQQISNEGFHARRGRKPTGLDATPSVRFYDSLKGGGGPESTKPC